MATYKIIGGDQKEYGPVNEETVRRWIGEGRANGQTRLLKEGEDGWRPLSSFMEFTDALRAQSGFTPPSDDAPPAKVAGWSDQLLARQPPLDIGRCLKGGLSLLKENFGLLFTSTFLLWVIGVACQFIPIIGGIAYWLFSGVLYGGLSMIYLNRLRGRPASVADLFAGFSTGIPQLMLVGAVSSLLSGIGLIFCIVPGVYLFVAWLFSIPLVADKRLEFWSAMELSRKMVTRIWFQVFGLLVLSLLPYIIAYLFIEMKIYASTLAVMQGFLNAGRADVERLLQIITSVAKTSFPFVMLIKFCLLLNLPFALGSLVYAYEDLFGARSPSHS